MSVVVFRPPNNGDLPFIVNAWLKSHRDAHPSVSSPVYFHEQKQVVMRLLNECETLLAVDPEMPDHILGFVCWDSKQSGPDKLQTLHYVYVKFALRRNGLGWKLLKEAGLQSPVYVSHVSKPTGLRILCDNPGHFFFNPWRASQ